jgi:ATP-binding cassette, subfamily B, bacterial
MSSFPFYKQLDAMDCGPTCLRMVAKHFGKSYSLNTLREKSYISREGVSLQGISEAAEAIGFKTLGTGMTVQTLVKEAPLPLIAHWKQNHFVVVYKIKKGKVHVADPALGLLTYSINDFKKNWASTKKNSEDVGICLLLEPTPAFFQSKEEKINKAGFRFLLSYLKPFKKLIWQLTIGLVAGSILLLLFPLLFQALVDYGINNKDIGFVYLILLAQLLFIIGRTSIEFIRSWILLHLSTRINVSLISDFLIKLMKLPVGFFETKLVGDILQRISDHRRIEEFLTTSTLTTLFSFLNLLIFGIVLAIYNISIFLIFTGSTLFYILWVSRFMGKRRVLDYARFEQLSENQSKVIQIINGIQEIKLNDSDIRKRWEWEGIQASLFRVNIKNLALNQYQNAGTIFIHEIASIVIIFIVAREVIEGQMTLGMMLAVSYILGQLKSPVEQFVGFLHKSQNAKISLERLSEVHEQDDEEQQKEVKLNLFPEKQDITISNLSFQYEGPHSPKVLKNLNMVIPQHKITAVVGVSGSGKTTLLKLLLGFYKPIEGEINIGEINLNNFDLKTWRNKCGVVMQDGYIFSDTIANNIALSSGRVDTSRLIEAARLANIQNYIEKLPLSYNTKIGMNGQGLSGGQKQRMLIARAIYKNPSFLFMDESTSSLDAENEKAIMHNLNSFFSSRTVVVVAHRLSTVKNADQIVVLDEGEIAEVGHHHELIEKKGQYYQLVKNQLELGT